LPPGPAAVPPLALLPELMSSWGTDRRYEVDTIGGSECVIRSEELECQIESRSLDLNSLDDVDMFAGRHLVTASALLDLVSEQWLSLLAARCREAGAAALFAMTYNGGSSCPPAEPEGEVIRELLNRHQKRTGGVAADPMCRQAARCFADAVIVR
jgi:hypothetical protein